MTTSISLSKSSSSGDEGKSSIVRTEDVTNESASIASSVETALSVCSQVELLTECPLWVPKAYEVRMKDSATSHGCIQLIMVHT